jgi:hypothetical protein
MAQATGSSVWILHLSTIVGTNEMHTCLGILSGMAQATGSSPPAAKHCL